MAKPLAAILALLLAAGCATTSMKKQFAKVDGQIDARTGYDVAWSGVTEPQDAISARVGEILNHPLTADGAVQVALLNNRELQASFSEMGIEIGEYIQAGLLPNPVAEVAVRLRDDKRIIEGSVFENFLEILLIPLRRERQGAQLKATQYQTVGDVIDWAAETRTAFWDYVAARQDAALAKDQTLSASGAYDMAVQLRAAGNIPLVFLQRQRADYERTKLDAAEAEMHAIEARERLNARMGLWGQGTEWTTNERVPDIPETEIELEHLENRAVEASVDLNITWYQMEAAARELGIRRVNAIIPQLRTGVDFERDLDKQLEIVKRDLGDETKYKLKETGEKKIWFVGPTIQWEVPLFDQKQGRRAAARMEMRRRWELFTALAIDIRNAARLAAYRLEYNRKRADFLEQVVVPVQHEVTLQSHLQYNAMFQGIFDLLRDKERELETSRQYLEALRQYWETRTQVEQLLMGRLYTPPISMMQESPRRRDGMMQAGDPTASDSLRGRQGGH